MNEGKHSTAEQSKYKMLGDSLKMPNGHLPNQGNGHVTEIEDGHSPIEGNVHPPKLSIERTEDKASEQPKGNKFQQAVRRHIGKDRLFHLVTNLMKSIEEEKRAHRELILSFETARNIKIDIPKPGGSDIRPKRRRKKLEVSLLDKIKTQREQTHEVVHAEIHTIPPSDEDKQCTDITKQITNGNELTETDDKIVGQLEFSAKDEQKKTDSEMLMHISEEDNLKSDVLDNASQHETNSDSKDNDGDLDNDEVESHCVNIHGLKSSSVQRSANLSEKTVVIDHLRTKDDNFDLNKLVLDSVLENTTTLVVDTSTNHSYENQIGLKNISDDQPESTSVEENVSNKDLTDQHSGFGQQVIVEVESDSSDEELHCDVNGKPDVLETNTNISLKGECINGDIYSTTKSSQLKDVHSKMIADKDCASNQETQCTIPKPSPSTTPEAERTASPFNSLQVRCSDNIIDIETNMASLKNLSRPSNSTYIYSSAVSDHGVPSQGDHCRKDIDNSEAKNCFSKRTIGPNDTEIQTLNSPGYLCIDLLQVYESNEDLQKLNLGRRFPNSTNKNLTRVRGDRSSPRKINSLQTKPIPAQPRGVQSNRNISASPSSSETSLPSLVKQTIQLRRYMKGIRSKRYTKPEIVLWNGLKVDNGEAKPNEDLSAKIKLPRIANGEEETQVKGENAGSMLREQQLGSLIRQECNITGIRNVEATKQNGKLFHNDCQRTAVRTINQSQLAKPR